MDLDKKILEKIERENIRIRPRWILELKNFSAWIWAVVLEVGAGLFLGMAVLFLLKKNNPYGGIILAGIFALLFFWGFRRFFEAGFRQFYKLGFAAVLLALFAVNGAIGYAFWGSGQAQRLDQGIKKTETYQKIEPVVEKALNIDKKDPNNTRETDTFSGDMNNNGKDYEDGDKADEEDEDQETETGEKNYSEDRSSDRDENRTEDENRENEDEDEGEKTETKSGSGDRDEEDIKESEDPEVKGVQAEKEAESDDQKVDESDEEEGQMDPREIESSGEKDGEDD